MCVMCVLLRFDHYVLNEGVGGAGPSHFIGSHDFAFKKLPHDQWPNLVIIEPAINCDIKWACALDLDNLIHTLKHVYVENHLKPPAFALLELICMNCMYGLLYRGHDTVEGRLAHMAYNDPGNYRCPPAGDVRTCPEDLYDVNYRGGMNGVYMLSLSRHYGFPFVSTTDAMYPAWARSYLENTVNDYWPGILQDNTHFSSSGATIIGGRILFSMLLNALKRTDAYQVPKQYGYYDYDTRLFLNKYIASIDYAIWSSWGNSHTLKLITQLNVSPLWSFIEVKGHAHGHRCFGSTTMDAEGTFEFLSLDSCLPGKCKLFIAYIHSWNSSFVGDMACHTESMSPPVLNTNKQEWNVTILGNTFNNLNIVDTLPRHTLVTDQLGSGKYKIVCKNLNPKLACISEIKIVH